MAAPQDRPKLGPFLALGLFFLIYIALPSGWKVFTQSSFNEFQAPLWDITSRISDLVNYWGHQADSKKTLITKNRDLSRIRADWNLQENLIGKWENEITKLNSLHAQVEALQIKIGLDSEKPLGSSCPSNSSKYMPGGKRFGRKGKRQNVYSGFGVIHSDGIVGRLTKLVSTHQPNSRPTQISNCSTFIRSTDHGFSGMVYVLVVSQCRLFLMSPTTSISKRKMI